MKRGLGPRLGGPARVFARRRSLALAAGFAISLAMSSVPAFAGTVTVDLLAPTHSRLAEDLRRELGASGFVVVFVEATSADWRVDVRRLPGSQARRGVVVRADEQSMTVFTRVASSDVIQTHLDQPVEPSDRMARRRACLGVVEYLRVLAENEAAVPSPPSSPPDSRELQPTRVARGGTARQGAAPPTQPGTVAPRSGLPDARLAQRPSDEVVPARPAPYAVAQVGGPADGAARDPTDGSPSGKPWQIGVGSTLGLESAPGGPTGHLQFLWYLPLEWRLAVCARVFWPVLGGQFRSAGSDVRTWGFGGNFGLQYAFDVGSPRLRPFVGPTLGTRVALTEATAANALQSRETFTPSVTFGAEGGVRYDLGSPIQLFFDVEVARGWLIPGMHRVDYEEAAANASSLHASFGVSFEI